MPLRATDPETLAVWPALAPGEKTASAGYLMEEDSLGFTRRTAVSAPTITLYRGGLSAAPACVLVCPGGGYGFLAEDVEGTEIASWLNQLGYVVGVLHYRVPENREGALQDAQRGISLLRSRAERLGVAADGFGMLGFSAGGHLTARTAADGDRRHYTPMDFVDGVSCRPSFAMLVCHAGLSRVSEGSR